MCQSTTASSPNPNSSTKSERQTDHGKFDYIITKSFRLQGVKGNLSKAKKENLVPTADQVNVILSAVGVKATVKEFKRLRKIKNDRARPRTFLVTLQSEHEVRMVLARPGDKRESLYQRSVFLLSALTKDDDLRESLVFQKRRQLLDEGMTSL